MKKRIFVILLGVLFLASLVVFASDEDEIYKMARAQAKAGNMDFAFMYFNALDRDYPKSDYREQVLFAKAEYYYQLLGYTQAGQIFRAFVDDYPKSNGKLFALGYLYKIAEMNKNQEALEAVKKEMLDSQQIGFIFKESKERKYRSSSFQNYRVIFRIDNMEFYKGGELFATVSY